MKDLLSALLMPLPVFFLLLTAGFFFIWRKKKKLTRLFLILSGFWFLVVTTQPVPNWLISNLEENYLQLTDSANHYLPDNFNIIVLGGGFSDDKSLSPNNQLSSVALGRLVEGVRIFKSAGYRGQKSKLIASGYSGRLKLSQAEVLYKTALILGMDSTDLVISSNPSNTYAEASEYVKMFGIDYPLVVVTSAVHMPRAVRIFKNAGVKVIPAPTNFLIKHGSVKNPWRWVPSSTNIEMMEHATHEYVGLLWNWMGGK